MPCIITWLQNLQWLNCRVEATLLAGCTQASWPIEKFTQSVLLVKNFLKDKLPLARSVLTFIHFTSAVVTNVCFMNYVIGRSQS